MPLPVVQSHMRIDELERHWLELFEEDVVAFVVLLLTMTYEDDVVRMSTISQPQHSSSFNVCLVCVIIIFCRTLEIKYLIDDHSKYLDNKRTDDT